MKNVILLTVDCLRHDALSERDTPNIMKLVENGWFFKRAYSLGCWTAPSLIGLLTSTYPFMYDGRLTIKYPRKSIAKTLNENGYSTGAFTFHPYLNSIYGYDMGFDEYFDDIDKYKDSKDKSVRDHWGQSDNFSRKLTFLFNKTGFLSSFFMKLNIFIYLKNLENKFNKDFNFYMPGNELNKHFIDWVKNKNDPFFCWLHYLDTHFPYISDSLEKDEMIRLNLLRQKWFLQQKNVNLNDLDKVKNLYTKKVHDVDKYIGELVNNLKKINKFENTLFVITADHGEEFYEHGSFHHDLKLYEELIHVPLIISGRGIKRHTIEKIVSHIDLSPTILDILGIKKPKLWVGDNILLKNQNIAISEEGQKTRGDARLSINFKLNLEAKKVAIVWDKWKYIYSEGNGEELYDLLVDKEEKENLLKEDKKNFNEVFNVARDILNKHINQVNRFKNF